MLIPGIASVTFRSLSPRQILALAKEAGLQSVEWGGDVHVPPDNLKHAREIAGRTADAGLIPLSYGSYFRLGAGDGVERWVETAHALGCGSLRIWAGSLASAQTMPADYTRLVEELRAACRVAMQAGISCSLEYHENTLADSAPAVLRLLRDVSDPSLRTYWQMIQPPAPSAALLEQVTTLQPFLSSLHVFQRPAQGPGLLPLADGAENWLKVLKVAACDGKRRGALVEFVRDEQVEAFKQDARTLVALCQRVDYEVAAASGVRG